ncbi:thioredoxin domain-containing protein [Croceivirga sp. JEA036]|uniref:thioredoxin domain-containing protein n=1 Tax=Croceivirga sp. JEA036 TaxID=2721162 RepID=UPI001FD74E83|nr:thioredoxin domain-containing protein [Croceivirga sp. JEA036]
MKKLQLALLTIILLTGCKNNQEAMKHKYTNALIEETSPYLLQHAHNPVNWEAWKPEVLERAQKENKPLLISIGYAACHWCHVMEDEVFENDSIAAYMNQNFVNIKIDREERPDVDQIYMDALQMMTGNGGWPLNIVALPDGRPFWGATYLPKENWTKSLESLVELYKNEPAKVEEFATNLEKGIKAINLVESKNSEVSFKDDELQLAVQKWSTYFDTFLGGYKRAPKFMMPNNLDFLLHYGVQQKNDSILEYVNTTLTRMAYGGIFDPIDGGFSRYAVDTKWHVPHFEKMLYDNGQLISLYSKAYAVTKNPLYKETVEKSIAFVRSELSDSNGGFYSSLDADSHNEDGELEEGAFYVWTETELKQLLGDKFETFKRYYNINSYGLWEDENYVLIRDKKDDEVAKELGITQADLQQTISESIVILKQERDKREKPRLDDKILTSWNGLMLKGLTDAYRYLQDESYLKLALANADFITSEMMNDDGSLYRNHKAEKSNINAFLEDYATVIEGFIGLYEVTFDEKWLKHAQKLMGYTLLHFKDDESGLFFYTSDKDQKLIRRSIEINDNVISSSNSIMANNLIKLHKIYPDKPYGEIVERMVAQVQDNFMTDAQTFANWLHLVQYNNHNFYEIALLGENYKSIGAELASHYIPNSILVGAANGNSKLPLLENRYVPGETMAYVCIEGSCKLPVNTASAVLKQL